MHIWICKQVITLSKFEVNYNSTIVLCIKTLVFIINLKHNEVRIIYKL